MCWTQFMQPHCIAKKVGGNDVFSMAQLRVNRLCIAIYITHGEMFSLSFRHVACFVMWVDGSHMFLKFWIQWISASKWFVWIKGTQNIEGGLYILLGLPEPTKFWTTMSYRFYSFTGSRSTYWPREQGYNFMRIVVKHILVTNLEHSLSVPQNFIGDHYLWFR